MVFAASIKWNLLFSLLGRSLLLVFQTSNSVSFYRHELRPLQSQNPKHIPFLLQPPQFSSLSNFLQAMESSTGAWERKLVINELMQGFEFAKELHSLHNPSSSSEVLTQSILSSLSKAINMLKSGDSEGETHQTDSPRSVSGSPHSENSNRTTFRDDECRAMSKKRYISQLEFLDSIQ